MASPDLYSTAPGYKFRLVTKGSPLPLGPCRAFWIGTAGTINFTDHSGTALTNFPAKAGLLPGGGRSVEASGTADDIWAVY